MKPYVTYRMVPCLVTLTDLYTVSSGPLSSCILYLTSKRGVLALAEFLVCRVAAIWGYATAYDGSMPVSAALSKGTHAAWMTINSRLHMGFFTMVRPRPIWNECGAKFLRPKSAKTSCFTPHVVYETHRTVHMAHGR